MRKKISKRKNGFGVRVNKHTEEGWWRRVIGFEKERSISISQKEYRPQALRCCEKVQPAPSQRLRPNNSDLTALAFAPCNPIIASATHKHTHTDTRTHTAVFILCGNFPLTSAQTGLETLGWIDKTITCIFSHSFTIRVDVRNHCNCKTRCFVLL